ncbi:2-hydroxyacid dehydrogenase [Roseateles sp. BYS180W]|uniref:2-hydroxyacid dehydrogenase n=1 Tax=Roseateles rivi TaxID=3299028 RepID=A0ABW7FTG7_9BURK
MAILLTGAWALDTEPGRAEQARWLHALQAVLPDEEWLLQAPHTAEQAQVVEVAVVANPAPGVLRQLPRLQLIQSLWAGVDRLLQDDTLPSAVPLCRMVDPVMTAAMVQTGLWAVLGLHRHFFQVQNQQAQQQWRQPPQRRADEWRVLVLGMGELGAALATQLRAQDYRVAGYSRRPHGVAGVAQVQGDEALLQALAEADTLVNLLPLTPATQHFFNAERLAQCRAGSTLVNLARGAHVDEAALLAALDRGHIHHAVLDVFQTEPLPQSHAFWRHPRVTVLPHTAAQTDPRSAAQVVAANVRALRTGQALMHRVDRGQRY